MLQLQALNRFLGRVKYKQMSNFVATRSPEPLTLMRTSPKRDGHAVVVFDVVVVVVVLVVVVVVVVVERIVK